MTVIYLIVIQSTPIKDCICSIFLKEAAIISIGFPSKAVHIDLTNSTPKSFSIFSECCFCQSKTLPTKGDIRVALACALAIA